MFDWDSRSVVRSLIGLFAVSSNPVSKVYQHRSRNDGILEVTWSTGSLRKNCKRYCCWIHFRNLLMEQARIEHAPNGSLLTYMSALMNNFMTWASSQDARTYRICTKNYFNTFADTSSGAWELDCRWVFAYIFILRMYEQRRLWRVCAIAQARLSHRCWTMW